MAGCGGSATVFDLSYEEFVSYYNEVGGNKVYAKFKTGNSYQSHRNLVNKG